MSLHWKEGIRKGALFLVSLLTASVTLANPEGGAVTSGDATITQTQGYTEINQASQKAIVEWKSFNIGASEHTHFQQPNNGIALNRIDPSQGISQILGQLTATGKIILINQAGIYFGSGARVDVGGLIASTSDISNMNFLSGNYRFDKPGYLGATITNEGIIRTAEHGLIALLGSAVDNKGYIEANSGTILLGSGNKFTIDLLGDGLVNFSVDEAVANASVKHSGTLIADGGKIHLSAKAASGVVDNVINTTGVIQAKSVSARNGEIILSGGEGVVRVAGKIIATGDTNKKGGKVHISGKHILIDNTAKIEVSGDVGGGEILIGGDYQGKVIAEGIKNAIATIIAPNAELIADALTKGDGGKVIVWADNYTGFYGKISARGGSQSGDGGFVETSGKAFLNSYGLVDTGALFGKVGTWLLDPRDVIISSDTTSGGSFDSTNPNTFAATGDNAVINISTLQTNLANGNVHITTGSSGSQAGNITISSGITWANGTSLTLTAAGDIAINAPITMNNNNASLILNAGRNITQTAAIKGTGGLTKQGARALTSPQYDAAVQATAQVASNTNTPSIISNAPSATPATYHVASKKKISSTTQTRETEKSDWTWNGNKASMNTSTVSQNIDQLVEQQVSESTPIVTAQYVVRSKGSPNAGGEIIISSQGE